MYMETCLLYLAALAVFFATPPDTSQMLIIVNSARFGLRSSMWTVAGDLTANVLQMTAAAFGIAAVIAASAGAFQILDRVGVAYLAWIGLRLITATSRNAGSGAAGGGSPAALFRQGFITSSANPLHGDVLRGIVPAVH